MGRVWKEDSSQKVWLGIGAVFLAFYAAEAYLFWGPNPRVAGALLHLAYWGVFGALLIGLIARSTGKSKSETWVDVIQSIVLGSAITVAVVGVPALVIYRTQDVTLAHAVLLYVIALAAIVIGAMSFNPGWLAAGCLWALAGCAVLCLPGLQDYLLGAVVGIGFCIIGLLRHRFKRIP